MDDGARAWTSDEKGVALAGAVTDTGSRQCEKVTVDVDRKSVV